MSIRSFSTTLLAVSLGCAAGRRVRVCGLAAAVVLLLLVARAGRAEEPATVSLRFDWPSPIAMQVERTFERLEQRPDGSAPPPLGSTARFVWRGAESGGKYRIAFSDFEVVRPEPRPASRDALVQLEYVSRSLEPLLPTIVVDEAGQPVDLEGLPALRARIAAEYALIPGLADDAQARRVMEVLGSDEVLAQRALEDWNRMVQVWHGVDAELGATKEIEADTGGAAGAAVRTVFSYSVERRLACPEAASGDACVRAVVRQIPRFGDVRAASTALLGFDFVTAFGAPPSARLEIENTFATETHPESLVPARYTKEKRWSVSWNDGSGARRVASRTDRWTYRFTPKK